MTSSIHSARGAAGSSLRIRVFAALVAGVVGFGCATTNDEFDEFAPDNTAAERSAPLGGEALVQMKSEMQRGLGDLIHFHSTLASLSERRDSTGFTHFAGFLDAYLGTHVDPLLAGEWQSRHPELMALDANLRLMKAELFILLRDTGRVQDTLEDLFARYQGRENMLVEYPDGKQGTLLEGLQKIQSGKWRG